MATPSDKVNEGLMVLNWIFKEVKKVDICGVLGMIILTKN